MAAILNSRTPIGDLQNITEVFDKKYPEIFDDKANAYIANIGKFRMTVFVNIFITTWGSLLLLSVSMENLNNNVGLLFAALAMAFFSYMFWRIFFIFSKNSTGKRAFERCAEAAGVTDAELRDYRRALELIRSLLDRKTSNGKTSSGGFFGVGCGTGGNSGCGSGGGGRGCGGGGGGGGG